MRKLAIILLAAVSWAQSNVTPAPPIKAQFFDASGKPLAGGKLYTYAAGTSTPLATYSESTGTTVNSNPIVLDSGGFAAVFLSGSAYKFILQNSAGVQQYSVDGIKGTYALFCPLVGCTFTGGVTFSGTVALNGATSFAQAISTLGVTDTGTSTFKNISGIRFSDGFASLAATFTDASTTGGVLIPPAAAAGGFTNTNKVAVLDLRGGVKSGPTYSVNIKQFGAVGDGATDDTTAFTSAIAYCQGLTALCSIKVPAGTFKVTSQLTLTKAISWDGEGKELSYIEGFGLGGGVSVMNYNCLTGARCDGVSIRGITFYSNNGLPNGLSLSWVFNSRFENVFFSTLANGLISTNSFSNTVADSVTYSITTDAYQLNDVSHDWKFYGGRIGSASFGIHVTGGAEGLLVDGVDCENTSTNGNCVLIAPTTGKLVNAVTIRNMHTENLGGAAVKINGADLNSTSGVTIQNNFFDGGRYTVPNTGAVDALILQNITSFNVSNNYFWDWQTDAIFRNATETQGTVVDNWLLVQPTKTAMTLFSASPSASIVQRNNRTQVSGSTDLPIGRQELYVSAIPSSAGLGTFNPGDIAYNTAPGAVGPFAWVNTVAGIPGTWSPLSPVLTATSAAIATATTAGTCVQAATAVAGATTGMAVAVSPVSSPGTGAVWSGWVSSAGNVTISECAVAISAGGSIAFNIRVIP